MHVIGTNAVAETFKSDQPSAGLTSAKKIYDEVWKVTRENPVESCIAIGATLAAGAALVSRGKIGAVSIIEAPITKLLRASDNNAASLPQGVLRGIDTSKGNLCQNLASKADRLFDWVTYRVPESQSVNITKLNLESAAPAVRHKSAAELISSELEEQHKIRRPASIANERNLSGAYLPMISRRYSSASNLNLLEIGPANSTAVPRAFDSRLGVYSTVDFSRPLIDQQASALQISNKIV